MDPEKLSIRTNGDSVSALVYFAPKKQRMDATLILGHGAGASQSHPFMRLFGSGLAERGLDVVTFNFLYMEQGRKVPDPGPKLESCYRAVIEAAAAHKKLQGNRIFIGGKSMGGRIASQVAALESVDSPSLSHSASSHVSSKSKLQASRRTPKTKIDGLIFLGYPLHPPGRPDKLRDAHLKDIAAPMLFIQGARDAFGTEDEICRLIKRLKLPATLHAINDGDHSLKAPKKSGATQEQIYEAAMDFIRDWLSNRIS